MRRASVGSVIQLPVMRLGSIGQMVSGMGFCCSSYKNKTTRRFKHCEEAWRVLVSAKVVLFIESAKLFDGKLFFDVDFVAFEIKRPADLSIVKRLGGFSWMHLFRLGLFDLC